MKILITESQTPVFFVTPSDIFYHGTVEPFDSRSLHVGGDGILWTSMDERIAKTYIPVSSFLYTNTEKFAFPSQDPTTIQFQKSIGIKYDLKTTEFSNIGRATSYYAAPIFRKISDRHYRISNELYKLEDEIKQMGGELDDHKRYNDDEFDEKFKEYNELIDKHDELMQLYRKTKPESIMYAYINKHIEKLGYRPTYKENNNNYSWKLKITGNEILPANYKSKGRLFQIIPKKKLKFYDMTKGMEPDLMDKQHNEYSFFKKLEYQEYDGVKINDHAQHEKWGNVPHKSWGFFKKAIPFLSIKVIDNAAQHPDDF